MNTRLAATDKLKLTAAPGLDPRPREAVRRADDGGDGWWLVHAARQANASAFPIAQALQRRRALLRRDQRTHHRPAGAGVCVRRHALRDVLHGGSDDGNPPSLPADDHGGVAHTYSGSELGLGRSPERSRLVVDVDAAGQVQPAIPTARSRCPCRSSPPRASSMTRSSTRAATWAPLPHSTRNVPTVLAAAPTAPSSAWPPPRVEADCKTNLWCSPTDAEFKAGTNNHILISIAQAFGLTDVRRVRDAAERRLEDRRRVRT